MINYDEFAHSFSRTRVSIWKEVKAFLDSLSPGATVLDAGCGNGKNMRYRNDLHVVGVDTSKAMLDICEERNLHVMEGDVRDLPFEDKTFDYVICVAVIHHLSTPTERIQACKELLRVSTKGVFITLWQSFKDSKSVTRKPIQHTGGTDYLVPWGIENLRYYHLYTEKEIEDLVQQIRLDNPNLSATVTLSHCNWNVTLSKN